MWVYVCVCVCVCVCDCMSELRHQYCRVKRRGKVKGLKPRNTRTQTHTHTHARATSESLCVHTAWSERQREREAEGDTKWESTRCKSLLTVVTQWQQVSDRNRGIHTDSQIVKLNVLNTVYEREREKRTLHIVNDRLNWCKQISLPVLLILHLIMERHSLPEDSQGKRFISLWTRFPNIMEY